jgi:hypothetical protein
MFLQFLEENTWSIFLGVFWANSMEKSLRTPIIEWSALIQLFFFECCISAKTLPVKQARNNRK